jgi:hypothetical protein
MAAKKSADLTVVEGPITGTSASLTAPPESNVFSAIERIMTDPNASVERANQAFEFYQKVEADKNRKAFDAAMADAKAEIPPILKTRKVSYGEGKNKTEYIHEDLASIAKVIDPILAKHGLSYRYRTTSNINEPIRCTCIISHRLGHFEENTLSAGADGSGGKNSIQAIGSTLQYLMRYSLKASLGLSAEENDSDGAKAGQDFITDAQADTLLTLIRDTKSDPQQFLEIAGVEMINDIPAANFKVVEGLLLAKKRKQGAPV